MSMNMPQRIMSNANRLTVLGLVCHVARLVCGTNSLTAHNVAQIDPNVRVAAKKASRTQKRTGKQLRLGTQGRAKANHVKAAATLIMVMIATPIMRCNVTNSWKPTTSDYVMSSTKNREQMIAMTVPNAMHPNKCSPYHMGAVRSHYHSYIRHYAACEISLQRTSERSKYYDSYAPCAR